MKPIKFLIVLTTLFLFSCSPEDEGVKDEKQQTLTEASIVGVYYLYYDNDVHELSQEDREPYGECEDDWLVIGKGEMLHGEFGKDCNMAQDSGLVKWHYVGESDSFENTMVIYIDDESYGGEYGIQLWNGLYRIFPHDYTFMRLTRAGNYAGHWKKKD
jgi:hypothetical protein